MPAHWLKCTIFALATLITVGDAAAQFAIGASGGISRANLWGDKPSNSTYQSILMIAGSASLEYQISSDVSITVQPGFERSGSNIGYKPPLGGGEVVDSVSVRLSYLKLPVLVRVFTKGAFFVTSGPVFGRLISASGKLEGSVDSVDLKDQFELADLGIGFGLGKKIPKGNFTAVVEFRVVWGLANIGITSASQSRVRAGSQQLIIGAQYALGGRP